MRTYEEIEESLTINMIDGDNSAIESDACDLMDLAKAMRSRIDEYESLVDMDCGDAIDKLIELSGEPL